MSIELRKDLFVAHRDEQRRAMQSSRGETMYRGKKLTVKQFGAPQPSPCKPELPLGRPKLPIKGQRLRVLCLNLGGI